MVERNCPNCGAVLNHEMSYCQFCGSAISRTKADFVDQTEFDKFYDSIRATNVDNKYYFHSFRWLLHIIYFVANITWAMPLMEGETYPAFINGGWKFRSAAYLIGYIILNYIVYSCVAKHYSRKAELPKAIDAQTFTLDFIEDQLKKLKMPWRWKASIRRETWLMCLTEFVQRPKITKESYRRVDEIEHEYRSNKIFVCILFALYNVIPCVALYALFWFNFTYIGIDL